MPAPTALIVLAPGAEEIEVVAVADLLVRAGVVATLASTQAIPMVVGSRGVPLGAHALLDRCAGPYDLVYLPGGAGSAQACREDARIQDLAEAQLRSGRLLAAMCAAPTALVPRRLCADRRVTSFPGVRDQVEPFARAWVDAPVVEDGNLVTAKAAGCSLHLGLALARHLAGPATAVQVGQQIHASPDVIQAAVEARHA